MTDPIAAPPRGPWSAAASSPPDLVSFIDPASIVLVAERERGEPGGEVEAALLKGGYAGAYRRAEADINGSFDLLTASAPELALVAVAAPSVPHVLEACARAGCRAAIVLNGPEGDLDASAAPWQTLGEAGAQRSVLLLGPNSQGVLSPATRLFAGTGSLVRSGVLRQGPIGVATQSGFGHALVALGDAAGLGFSHIFATGNEAGLDSVGVARWLVDRAEVRLVWLLLEGVRDGRGLVDLGRHASQLGKSILIWKTGQSEPGSRAAATHTGALASDERILGAAIHAGGLIPVHGEDALIDASRALLAGRPLPAGASVGVVTVSGGAGVALADCLTNAGLDLPALAPRTTALLERLTPGAHRVNNPLDVTRSVTRALDTYRRVLQALVHDPRVDQLIVCHGGIDGPNADGLAAAVKTTAATTPKPISVVWATRPGRAASSLAILDEAAVPSFASVHRAAGAAAVLARAGLVQRAALTGVSGEGGRVGGPTRLKRSPVTIGEYRSLEYLASYGMPVVAEVRLPVVDGRIEAPATWPLRFPVAVKVDTTSVKSRADAGLVRLAVRTPGEVMETGRRLVARAARRGVVFDGLLVAEMQSGLEAWLGGLVDTRFGPVVALGLGGPDVESVSRPVFRLAPLSTAAAFETVGAWELHGRLSWRQRRAVADALARLSWLLADNADWIAQVDVNPLFITRTGVVAGDAVIVPQVVP